VVKRDRQKFLKVTLIFVLLISVALSVFTLIFMPGIRKQALSNLMNHKTEQTLTRFNDFVNPVISNLQLLRQWGEGGVLESLDRVDLERLLIPLLDQHLPHVSGLILADTSGSFRYLLKENTTWLNKMAQKNFDPQQSPWFKGAIDELDNGEIFWTDMYPLPLIEKLGLASSVAWKKPDDPDTTQVAAIQILHEDIKNMIDQLPLGTRGKVLLIDEDYVREFTRFRGAETQPTDKVLMDSLNLIRSPEINNALTAWHRFESKEGQPIQYLTQGQSWWIEVNSSLFRREIRLGVILPDRLLQKEISRLSYVLIYAVLTALVILLFVLIVFLRRYSRQAESVLAMKRHTDSIEEEIRALVKSGERADLEFKSTLRWNLKTDKADKHIELASLKTIVAFLNSEGGTLLIGVGDNGAALGIEKDRFASEDKYLLHFNNLIRQHIGLEFSQHIYFEIKDLDGKKILVVDCEPSENPVFLKHNSTEDFYVRVGPGSRKLPTSKVLEYIKNREFS
jgi:hypothetical protein